MGEAIIARRGMRMTKIHYTKLNGLYLVPIETGYSGEIYTNYHWNFFYRRVGLIIYKQDLEQFSIIQQFSLTQPTDYTLYRMFTDNQGNIYIIWQHSTSTTQYIVQIYDANFNLLRSGNINIGSPTTWAVSLNGDYMVVTIGNSFYIYNISNLTLANNGTYSSSNLQIPITVFTDKYMLTWDASDYIVRLYNSSGGLFAIIDSGSPNGYEVIYQNSNNDFVISAALGGYATDIIRGQRQTKIYRINGVRGRCVNGKLLIMQQNSSLSSTIPGAFDLNLVDKDTGNVIGTIATATLYGTFSVHQTVVSIVSNNNEKFHVKNLAYNVYYTVLN